jgi:hypothetical protein
MYNQSYTLSVAGDSTIYVKMPQTATYSGNATYSLKAGQNVVKLPVRSQSGYDNFYTLTITAAKDCTLTVSTDGRKIVKGDTNFDGKINGIDVANVQKHIVGRITLTDINFTAADTNGDGKINGIDVANVQKHIVGRITLS